MSRRDRTEAAGSAIEVEFGLGESRYPFVAASEAADCRFELAEMIPRSDDRYAEFFNVTGAETERILDLASSEPDLEASCLREYERGGLFEFQVSGSCPAVSLAERGALPREVRSEGGTGRIVAQIPSKRDASALIEGFLDEASEVELRRKREIDAVTPIFSPSMFQQFLEGRLTDRQTEVLRQAYEEGYYDWPRRASGTEVARALDISSATFSEHIHAAERKLLGIVFEETC